MVCVDLGSNTLRACVMDDSLEVARSFERVVASARNLTKQGLASDAMERIERAVGELVAEFGPGEYRAVATAAFRASPNASAFFERIWAEFGVKFEIISGLDEAKLTRLGILNRARKLGLGSDFLSIDLGGASTEICWGGGCESFDFGIVKFSSVKSLEQARLITAGARAFIDSAKYENIVLNSGVPTSVAAVKIGMKYADYDARKINGMRLNLRDFDLAFEKIKNACDPGILIGEGRGDVLLAGICLLKSLLTGLERDFIVIDDGLREGLACALLKSR